VGIRAGELEVEGLVLAHHEVLVGTGDRGLVGESRAGGAGQHGHEQEKARPCAGEDGGELGAGYLPGAMSVARRLEDQGLPGNLWPGEWTLEIRESGGATWSAVFTIRAGETVDVVLTR
jgi:hypothetical protein